MHSLSISSWFHTKYINWHCKYLFWLSLGAMTPQAVNYHSLELSAVIANIPQLCMQVLYSLVYIPQKNQIKPWNENDIYQIVASSICIWITYVHVSEQNRGKGKEIHTNVFLWGLSSHKIKISSLTLSLSFFFNQREF